MKVPSGTPLLRCLSFWSIRAPDASGRCARFPYDGRGKLAQLSQGVRACDVTARAAVQALTTSTQSRVTRQMGRAWSVRARKLVKAKPLMLQALDARVRASGPYRV